MFLVPGRSPPRRLSSNGLGSGLRRAPAPDLPGGRLLFAAFGAMALALGCNQGARSNASGQAPSPPLASASAASGAPALGAAPSGAGSGAVAAPTSSVGAATAASVETPSTSSAFARSVGDKPEARLSVFGGEVRAVLSVDAKGALGVQVELEREGRVVFRAEGLEALTGSRALPPGFDACDTWDADARPLKLFGGEGARLSLVCTVGADFLTVHELAVLLAKEGGGVAAVWAGPGDELHNEMDQCVTATSVEFTSEGPATIVRRARSEAHWTSQGLPSPRRRDCKAAAPSVTRHARRRP